MKKSIFCAAVILLAAGAMNASVLTGNVAITSGSAWASDQCCSGFEIAGQNFSVPETETLFGWDFFSRAITPGNGEIPTAGTVVSVSGTITPPDEFINCGYATSTFMGAQAQCFGPICDPDYCSGLPSGSGATEGINFTGTATVKPDGSATGTFTATGELIGFTPAGCGNPDPHACTEVYDVTLSGSGTMTISPGNPNQFYSLGLQFSDPAPADEPSTDMLLAIGLAFAAVYRKRSTKTFV